MQSLRFMILDVEMWLQNIKIIKSNYKIEGYIKRMSTYSAEMQLFRFHHQYPADKSGASLRY
jgi:hypothetical protein